jgi:hypothetical protein
MGCNMKFSKKYKMQCQIKTNELLAQTEINPNLIKAHKQGLTTHYYAMGRYLVSTTHVDGEFYAFIDNDRDHKIEINIEGINGTNSHN